MSRLISARRGPAVHLLPVEIVERKGLGHPDSICDSLAEEFSLALSRHYLDRFGAVLHHNVDKALLRGGTAQVAFGGGEVVEPIDIYMAGRAVVEAEGQRVPMEELTVETVRAWFRRNFRALDPERHLRVHCLVRPGSVDLAELFSRRRGAAIPLANDTSCGIGFAPLTPLEATVLAVERAITDAGFRTRHPAVGEDVKVMGVRQHERLHLTVACAAVAAHVPDMAAYRRFRELVAEEARKAARRVSDLPIEIAVNTGDKDTPGGIYLTATGTSAEAGDDGEVGRGNRCNGLITPYRPMTMEASAGKNPITHVGKLYSLIGGLAADAVCREASGVLGAECLLVSQIGHPIDSPQIVDLRLELADGATIDDLRDAATRVLEREIGRLPGLWRDVLSRRVAIDRWPPQG